MEPTLELESSLAADYALKNEDYFEVSRREMLPYVPDSCRTILDVGCGKGSFGVILRERQPCEVWGVEPDARGIPQARVNLHKVLQGCFAPGMELPADYFDAIIFNDVLEHMLDPLGALQYSKSLLKTKGVVVSSIPNIGHFPTVWKLVMHGDWDYKDRGILDKTHVRFFTRNNITKMFNQAGFKIRSIKGINPYFSMEPEDRKLWNYYHITKLIPAGGVHDMRYLQFAVVAEKSDRTLISSDEQPSDHRHSILQASVSGCRPGIIGGADARRLQGVHRG